MFIEIHDGILLNADHIKRITPWNTIQGIPQSRIQMQDGEEINTHTP